MPLLIDSKMYESYEAYKAEMERLTGEVNALPMSSFLRLLEMVVEYRVATSFLWQTDDPREDKMVPNRITEVVQNAILGVYRHNLQQEGELAAALEHALLVSAKAIGLRGETPAAKKARRAYIASVIKPVKSRTRFRAYEHFENEENES